MASFLWLLVFFTKLSKVQCRVERFIAIFLKFKKKIERPMAKSNLPRSSSNFFQLFSTCSQLFSTILQLFQHSSQLFCQLFFSFWAWQVPRWNLPTLDGLFVDRLVPPLSQITFHQDTWVLMRVWACVFVACWFVACFFCFCLWPIVPRSFANHCKSSSHTRESRTDKASCSIGYGAKKNRSPRSLFQLFFNFWFFQFFNFFCKLFPTFFQLFSQLFSQLFVQLFVQLFSQLFFQLFSL